LISLICYILVSAHTQHLHSFPTRRSSDLANIAIIKQDPQLFFEVYHDWFGKGYTLFNEVILDGFFHLPTTYSNEIILYLVENIELNMFSYTSGDTLKLSQEIIKKHLPGCTKKNRDFFIDNVIAYFPENTIKRYKSRIQYNTENRPKRVFWPFWGVLQVLILNLIDDAHLNRHSLQLKQVLNRKFEIGIYTYKKFDFKSGWVRAAISNKNLTLRNWEQILQSKKIRKRGE